MSEPAETTQVSGTRDDAQRDELVDAVRALSAQVDGLRGEIEALRSDASPLPATTADEHGWDARPALAADGSPWIRSLDTPTGRRPAIPRFTLEIFFLIAVAALAAIASLPAPTIAGLLAGAWLLVAVAEWAASRSERQRETVFTTAAGGPTVRGDSSWFAEAPETTQALRAPAAAQDTAKLPPAQSS